jgi:ATP-dependent RNA helicase DHX57
MPDTSTSQAPPRVGVLLKEIRTRLDRVLSDKIDRPAEDVQASGKSGTRNPQL